MSGGSFDYGYEELDRYIGCMEDTELDEMMSDLQNVLHDLEWWKSSDISEENYRNEVHRFKNKWFGTRDKKLRERVLKALDDVKTQIDNL